MAENMVNGIIAKTNGRDKVVDFRDGLVPAKVEDYAMLHGAGGKHHAASSVIKCFICDYSGGTGSASRTVSANISPELCAQIYEICKQNIGTQVMDNKVLFAEQRAVNTKLSTVADLQAGFFDTVLEVLVRMKAAAKEGKTLSLESVAQVLRVLMKDKKKTVAEGAAKVEPCAPTLTLARHVDWSHTQDRVHNYANKTGGGDIAPVQRLQIWHQTYRKQGDLGNYPWTIKVINGKAKVRVQATGATTFDASSMTDIEEAFIQISDADMFRMMHRVNHYINVWENTIAGDVVRQGLAKREELRRQAAAEERGY